MNMNTSPYTITAVTASLPGQLYPEPRYQTRHVYVTIPGDIRVELCSFWHGRIEVYVFEDSIPMFACYLDQMNEQSQEVLGGLFEAGMVQLERADRAVLRARRVDPWTSVERQFAIRHRTLRAA